MTADFGLAVRYKLAGETDYSIQPVDDAAEQARLVRHMWVNQQLAAVPVSLTFEVDKKALAGITRDIVEETLALYLEGELVEDEDPLARIRALSPALIDEPTDAARTDVHLTRAFWWDELTNADDRAQKLRDGFLDDTQYDLDGEEARRDYARDVLAGVVVPNHAKASA